jgi:hypothetical protein
MDKPIPCFASLYRSGSKRPPQCVSIFGMSPRWNLLLAIVTMALALMETVSGEALAGYGKTIDRANNPRNFWKALAIHYAFSLFFWLLYLKHLFPR